MRSFEDGIGNFESLYWGFSRERTFYAQLTKTLSKDMGGKTTSNDLSSMTIYPMPKRQTLDKKMKPPRPNKANNSASNYHEPIQATSSFSRLSTLPAVASDYTNRKTTEENKENLPATIGNLPLKNEFSGTITKKQFLIRRPSPSSSLVHDKSENQSIEKPSNLVKSSSVKYKNLVDHSRSASSEVNMVGMLNKLPKISSRSWVVLDSQSKEALFGYKYCIKREIASLTKLMTLFTACKIIEDSKLNAKKYECIVTQNASSKIGTSANLKTGDKVSLYDLLFGSFTSFRYDAPVGE